MYTTSYICMQVSRNLADNNTPQLCLLNAQISDFLTFWRTPDFIISVSSQSRGQRIACVAAPVTEILPSKTCRKIICKRKQLFLLIYYGIYLPIGWSLALTHADNLCEGYVFLLQVKSAMIIFVFLHRKLQSKACLLA